MTLLRLAWRNVWRHRQRTLLLVIVVAYATLTTVFFWSFADGYAASVIDAHARYIAAPVRVASVAWYADPDPENGLPSLEAFKPLEAVPGVRAVVPRLEFPALLRSAYASEPVTVRGVDPGLERRVSRVPGKVGRGRWLEGPGEVVLGYKLAERLDVRLGERVVLDTAALAGPQARGLTLVGVVDAGVSTVDHAGVFVHLADARALTGLDTATTLALDVPRGREAEVARAVQALLPKGLEARQVWDLIGPIKTDVQASKIMAIPIGLLFALFAAAAVTSTVLVSVMERTREFGVIAALGLSTRALAGLVALESILATALGWVVGLGLGYALITYTATHNVFGPLFAASGEAFTAAGLTEEFYTVVHPVYALYALATVVFAGLLATLIPGRRVRALKPAEAMRAE